MDLFWSSHPRGADHRQTQTIRTHLLLLHCQTPPPSQRAAHALSSLSPLLLCDEKKKKTLRPLHQSRNDLKAVIRVCMHALSRRNNGMMCEKQNEKQNKTLYSLLRASLSSSWQVEGIRNQGGHAHIKPNLIDTCSIFFSFFTPVVG